MVTYEMNNAEALCHSSGPYEGRTFFNKDESLEHREWKHHKYIRKEGKKYIYKETRTDEDGTTWDKYVADDGSSMTQQRNYKYDPERYTRDKFTKDIAKDANDAGVEFKNRDDIINDGKQLVAKLTDDKGDEEKEKKYFVKHDDTDNDENSLAHHGVLGQKWGIRRFQNKDGSLTELGKKRASEGAEGVSKVLKKGQADARNTRILGKVKGLATYATSTIGGTAAGGALGSTTGPAGTIAGATVGGLTGAVAGRAANAIIKMHANEKAAALSQEYQLLGQKMMEEYSGKKVSEIISKADTDDSSKKQEYFNKRNSFKTDEDKDLWEAQQQATSKKEKDKIIDDRVKLAKKTNQYDMEFLERNLDVDDETGEQLKGKALDDAYKKYLQKEKNYYK